MLGLLVPRVPIKTYGSHSHQADPSDLGLRTPGSRDPAATALDSAARPSTALHSSDQTNAQRGGSPMRHARSASTCKRWQTPRRVSTPATTARPRYAAIVSFVSDVDSTPRDRETQQELQRRSPCRSIRFAVVSPNHSEPDAKFRPSHRQQHESGAFHVRPLPRRHRDPETRTALIAITGAVPSEQPRPGVGDPEQDSHAGEDERCEGRAHPGRPHRRVGDEPRWRRRSPDGGSSKSGGNRRSNAMQRTRNQDTAGKQRCL